MSKIRIDNRNTSVTKRYIELFSSRILYLFQNDPFSYKKHIGIQSWSSVNPTQVFFDYKRITRQYQVTGLIDKDSSFTSTTYNTVSSSDTAWDVFFLLEEIAQSGGVVTLSHLYGSTTKTFTGMITNLQCFEIPEDQDGTSVSETLDVSFTLIIGENSY